MRSLNTQEQIIEPLINRYQGFIMPPYLFEREILSTRMEKPGAGESSARTDRLGKSIDNGEVIIQCYKSSSETRNLIKFLRRGDGHLFNNDNSENENIDGLTAKVKTVFQFLRENGASHFQDIESGTNLTPVQLRDVLEQTVRNGLITTDNYDSFLSMIGSTQKPTNRPRGRSSRHSLRQNVQNQLLIKSGRWFLTSSFAVMGKKISMDERLERQARILLQRYGILVKEFYRREVGFLPWYQLFQVLKRMEWQGEIRRSIGNHLVFLCEEPVLYSENNGNRIWTVKTLINNDLEIILNSFKNWLRLPDMIRARKKIEIELINDNQATESDLADIFYTVGFEREGSSIVLWPSGL